MFKSHSLTSDISELQSILFEFSDKIHALQSELEESEARYQSLLEEIRLARHHRFGRSSEASPDQGDLFNEAEQECDAEDKPELETVTYERKKSSKGRPPLPSHLPREEVILDIPEDAKSCACCGNDLHKMGEERSEKLEFIPAKLLVKEFVRPKYSCRHCEQTQTQVKIVMAPPEPSIIPKGIATPSLLAQIITNKFHYALPLYRQESVFTRLGIVLSRQTMSQWLMKCSEALAPLMALLKAELLKQGVLFADETTLNVLDNGRAKSYIWVYGCGSDRNGSSQSPSIVLFDYQDGSRGAHCPVNYLQGFQGYLQVDGYQAYEDTDATLVGCLAHARRKFVEAEKCLPSNAKKKPGKVQWALSQFKKLYKIERLLKGASPEEVVEKRQQDALPILKEFKVWLDKSVSQVLPKSKLGEAIRYCLNQWTKLIRYVDDGRLSIDNNRAERSVRPFAVGRKNWQFAKTHNGAEASAMLYSLVETAKANGREPYEYIEYVLRELPRIEPGGDYSVLLPWNSS